jgi:PAS domain S-box-containing protein
VADKTRAQATARNREVELARVQQIGGVAGVDIDLDGLNGHRSPEYLRLHGLPPGIVIESHDAWLARVHPEDRERADATLREAIASGGLAYRSEYRIILPSDGQVRWISAIGEIERGTSGEPLRLVGAHIDITEQKLVAEALREGEARQAFLLRLSDAVRGLADPFDVQGEASRMLAHELGLDRAFYATVERADQGEWFVVERDFHAPDIGSAVGRHATETFGRTALERLGAGHTYVVDDVTDLPEADVGRREFTAIDVRAYGAVPLVKGGKLVATLGFLTRRPRHWTEGEIALLEATAERTWAAVERARAEQALRGSEEQLREADARKDEFLATLAHELRNPLAPIRSSVELLRQPLGAADTARVHRILERQVNHMVRLVDDLMEVSRISRGAIDLRQQALDLRRVVEEAIEFARPAIVAGRHELALALSDEPIRVAGDPVRLVQIVSNLIANAARYTDPGGRIEVRAWSDGDARVAVSDTGIGIAAAHLAGVFTMFGQIDRNDARSQAGLGVGLSLGQRLARMHGGDIEAASPGPGRGSTFTLRLPLTERADDPLLAMRDGVAPAGLIKVLLVDDNRDAADSTEMLLRARGFDARVAYLGTAALAMLQDWAPHAALIDLGMPGMDGFELARRIRSADNGWDLKLIALTGWGQSTDVVRTREAGFIAHLVKPVNADLLLDVLRRATASPLA